MTPLTTIYGLPLSVRHADKWRRDRRRRLTVAALLFVAGLAALVGLLVSPGCTNSSAANSALRGAGYRDVKLTGWAPMSCSEDDGTSTGFTAKGPTGEAVTGVVCCGWVFKGCTIRVTR